MLYIFMVDAGKINEKIAIFTQLKLRNPFLMEKSRWKSYLSEFFLYDINIYDINIYKVSSLLYFP